MSQSKFFKRPIWVNSSGEEKDIISLIEGVQTNVETVQSNLNTESSTLQNNINLLEAQVLALQNVVDSKKMLVATVNAQVAMHSARTVLLDSPVSLAGRTFCIVGTSSSTTGPYEERIIKFPENMSGHFQSIITGIQHDDGVAYLNIVRIFPEWGGSAYSRLGASGEHINLADGTATYTLGPASWFVSKVYEIFD